MKPEEALERLKAIGLEINFLSYTFDTRTKWKEAVGIAIQALEKQVPKKPNIKELPDSFGRLYWNVCGTCDEEINSDYEYCPDCGHRIDWSVEE